MDDRGAQPGPITAVFFIHVLDDFLAPLMLEIHIDIGRLITLLGQEPLKQNVMFFGVYRRDSQDRNTPPNWPPTRAPDTGSAAWRPAARTAQCR